MKARTLALCGIALGCLIAPASAQQVTKICVANTTNTGCTPVDSNNPFPVTGGGSGSNASVGANGSAGPTSSTQVGIRDAGGNLQPASATNPVPVTGTFSATLAGFTPTAGATASLAVSGTTADVVMPAGTDMVVSNPSQSVPVFFRVQIGSGTAVATDMLLNPQEHYGFHVLTNTHLSAITGGGTTTLSLQGGAGLILPYGGTAASNTAQVNGVTVLAGAGATGTGSQRTTAAQDTSTIAGSAPGTAGTASPNVVSVQGVAGGTAQPVSLAANQSVNTAQVNGVTTLTGAGATGTGAQRVTASQDTTTVAGAAPLTTGIFVTGPSAAALGTAANQTSQITQETASAAALGTTADTVCASATGTCTLEALVKFLNNAATASTPAGANTIGGTVPTPSATGGPTLFSLIAANSTNATVIKASAGTLYHVSVYNNSATPAYLSFINTATTPTCTTTPVYQVLIPANSTSGAGAVEDFALGAAFTTGISACVTTGIGGTGSVAATAYSINATFK